MDKMREKILRTAKKVIDAGDLCLLATVGLDGYPRVRYMGAFTVEKGFVVHLVCKAGSAKVREIDRQAKAQLIFWRPDFQTVVSLSGQAENVRSLKVRRRIYRAIAPLQLFPGFDDTFAVIRFATEHVEYLNLRACDRTLRVAC